MKRLLGVLGILFAVFGAAQAQMPDVSIKLNLYANYRTEEQEDRTTTRLYDPLGHLSTVGLMIRSDLGLQLYVSQKLQVIPHGGDPDQLDEYYVESGSYWRVGKQYLPFGQGQLLHESALAVRSNFYLDALDVPISVAGCDAGQGRQLGVVGRVGDHLGVSAAYGEHFGISGTSFDLVRSPTQAADVGHGFRQIYGIDYGSSQDQWRYSLEGVALRGPETPTDQSDFLVDGYVLYEADKENSYGFGVTHSARERADFVRVQAFLKVVPQVSVEPMLRMRNGSLYDLSLTLHVKF